MWVAGRAHGYLDDQEAFLMPSLQTNLVLPGSCVAFSSATVHRIVSEHLQLWSEGCDKAVTIAGWP